MRRGMSWLEPRCITDRSSRRSRPLPQVSALYTYVSYFSTFFAEKIEMAVEKLRHAEDTHERVLKDNKALRQELDRREADLSSLSDRYQAS